MNKKEHIIKLLLAGTDIETIVKYVNTTKLYVRKVQYEVNKINGIEHWIQHHVKYEELHGVDEIVWMTNGDHQKLHNRLRRENRCDVLPDDLHKISTIAHRRTDRYKNAKKTYAHSESGRNVLLNYKNNNIKRIDFNESMGTNIRLSEDIRYNTASGAVCYYADFRGDNGFKLPVIDI